MVPCSEPAAERPPVAATDIAGPAITLRELDVIYRAHRSRCLMIARRITGEEQLAEDVVHEVFLALWNGSAHFDEARGTLASWLSVLTKHKSVDALRARHRGLHDADPLDDIVLLPDATPTVEDEVCRHLQSEAVQSALQRLPAAQRDVLVMAYLSGLSLVTIARVTGTPLGTVKWRARAGQARLRVLLMRMD